MNEPGTSDWRLYKTAPDERCYECGEPVRSESFETRVETINGEVKYFHGDGCFEEFIRKNGGCNG